MLAQLWFGRFFLAARKPRGVMGEEGARRVCVRRLQTPVLAAPEPRDEPRAERPTQRFALLSPSFSVFRSGGRRGRWPSLPAERAQLQGKPYVRVYELVHACPRACVPSSTCTAFLMDSAQRFCSLAKGMLEVNSRSRSW